MDDDIKKLLLSQNSLLLNIFSSQILLLVNQRRENISNDLNKDSSIKHEVQTIHRELKEIKDLVKKYYS